MATDTNPAALAFALVDALETEVSQADFRVTSEAKRIALDLQVPARSLKGPARGCACIVGMMVRGSSIGSQLSRNSFLTETSSVRLFALAA